MKNVVKYDKNSKIMDVTDTDIKDTEYWESIAKEAVEEAVNKHNDKNISSTYGIEKESF